ncbi:MAG: restriction endonuclease subunit S, partial [Peptostreptococcaceae bacterium]|nr:restriction endonuclease subunit S [Peptostreptococcaceae bacterium]
NLSKERVSPSKIESKYMLDFGDILFARSGATVGKNYVHLIDEPAIYAGYLVCLKVNSAMALPKFVYYSVNTSWYNKFVYERKSNSSQPNINAQQYSAFKIPLPSLEVQKYIVEKLDKFDTLVHDISQGLPKEIELREKQYIYYRERLLNFSKED